MCCSISCLFVKFYSLKPGPDLASAGPNSKRVRGAPKTQLFIEKKAKIYKITKMAITLALIIRFEKFKKFWKAENLLFAGPPSGAGPDSGESVESA